ncbi:MAG: Eco57I restriction-modification methylase domain-containing protein [Candidatus Hodarchaeales archaeon]
MIEKNNIRMKKELGVFYTPPNLAVSFTREALHTHLLNSMTKKFQKKYDSIENLFSNGNTKEISYLSDTIQNLTILDCSVGEGMFLIAALQELSAIQSIIPLKHINSSDYLNYKIKMNLYGVDINRNAVDITREKIKSFNCPNNAKNIRPILRERIITKNFLDLTLDDFNLSHGFDIILGNPPWGGRLDPDTKDYYCDLFGIKSPKRNLNSFELFVYKAPYLLKKSGSFLAYLLPKNIARSNQYTSLRKYILDNFQILSLSFFGLFKDVTQEYLAIVASKTNEIDTNHKIIVDKKNLIPQSAYHDNYDYIFTREFDPTSQEIKKNIIKDSILLGDLVTIKRGEELSKRGGVMFCTNCERWVQLSSRKSKIICPQCKSILQGEGLKKKFLISNQPHGSTVQPIITGDDFTSFFINSSHFIDPDFVFRSKKNPSIYKPPKLVLKKIAKYPCVAFDPEGYWTTQNVYNLRTKSGQSDEEHLLLYIMAILNSSLYKWFYEHQFNLKSNYTNAISIFNLKRLPIKNPNYNPQLVDKIVSTTRNVLIKRHNSSEDIELLDTLVLELYDLTKYSKILKL